jgi:hypothetical protein
LPEKTYAGRGIELFHGGSARSATLTRDFGVRVDTNSSSPGRRQWGRGYYLGITREVGQEYADQRGDGAVVRFAEVPLAALGQVVDVTAGPGLVAWDQFLDQDQGGFTYRYVWESQPEAREAVVNMFLGDNQLNPDVLIAPYKETNQVIIRSEQAARTLDLFFAEPTQ